MPRLPMIKQLVGGRDMLGEPSDPKPGILSSVLGNHTVLQRPMATSEDISDHHSSEGLVSDALVLWCRRSGILL